MPIDFNNAIPNPVPAFAWRPANADVEYIDSLLFSSDETERARGIALKLGCLVLEHPKLPLIALIDMDDLASKEGSPKDKSIKEITPQDCQGVQAKIVDKEIGNPMDRIIFGVNKIMEDRKRKLIEKEENEFIFFKIVTNEDRSLSVEVSFPSLEFSKPKYWLVKFFNTGGEVIRVNRIPIINDSFSKPNEEDVQYLDSILEASFAVLESNL